jgi:hypothetical protein
MNHWRRTSEQRTEAWTFLSNLSLDVALVQEALPPPDVRAVYRSGGIDARRKWGSAVVSFGGDLVELGQVTSAFAKQDMDLLQTFPGSVAVAQSTAGEGTVFISAYGLLDGGYAVTTMHRVLSDITPLLDRDLGKRLIIGGDFNCSTQLPAGRDRERHRNLFERFATLGLIELLALTADTRPKLANCPCSDEPCRHVQTLRHDRSAVPWHNDYLFATAALAERMRDCQPLDGPDVWRFSDHCPIVAEFE